MTAFKVMRKGGDAMLKTIKRFIREEDGIGTVEMILILVVLIGVLVCFECARDADRRAFLEILADSLSALLPSLTSYEIRWSILALRVLAIVYCDCKLYNRLTTLSLS